MINKIYAISNTKEKRSSPTQTHLTHHFKRKKKKNKKERQKKITETKISRRIEKDHQLYQRRHQNHQKLSNGSEKLETRVRAKQIIQK